jgi:hypothetical protein
VGDVLAVPQALWGIERRTLFRGALISNGCRSRMLPQLRSYGMDIAKWGSTFCRINDFKGLGVAKR